MLMLVVDGCCQVDECFGGKVQKFPCSVSILVEKLLQAI